LNLDPRLFRLARQGSIPLAIAILLGFAAGVLTVWQAWTLSAVIGGAFLHGQALPQLTRPLALLLALMLLRALLTWGSETAAATLARGVKTSLRRQLAAHLFRLGPIGIGQERTGELSLAVSQGIETLDAYFSQYLPQLALAALVPLAFLLFVFPIDPLTGLVLLLTAPLLPMFMMLVGSLAQSATRRQWRTLARLNAYFLDVLQGLSTLKMFGRSRQQGAVVESAGESYRQATISVLRVAFLSALTLEMVATLSTAVVAVEVGLRLLYFRLTFEQAFLVLLLAPEFYLPLRLLGARFHAGMSGMAAAEQIFSILEQPPLSESQAPQPEQPAVPRGTPPAIRFQNVHLTYPDGRRALNGISFEIAPGKITALVGPSGAGKSSIASLLLRFIRPTVGDILVDQVPLGEIPLQTWLRQVAWVPQSPYLFNESLAANVRLGAPSATQEQVAQACRLAGAEDFIRELPLGYQTPLGERGRRLSGGQAQRVALARAFLQDAPLLILDEPAASLDPALESELNESVERLAAGRTVLVIAHRLSTARRADHIVVLEDGQVVRHGTHNELAHTDGLYRRLLQACPANETFQAARTAEHIPPSPQSGKPSPLTEADEASSAAHSFPDERPISGADTPPEKRTTKPFWRLISLAASIRGWIALSVLAGAATIASSIGLMSASAYIISAAALHPSIADLQVAIVGVRFFGLARGIFRYLERLVSHQAAFRLLARLRVWFYNALEPLAPAQLLRYRSGDLLTRLIEDIETLENFYVRALAPPLVGLVVALGITVFFWHFDASLALTLLGFHLLTGAGVPLLARLAGRRYGRGLVAGRAALNAFLTDMVQGMPDLLATNQREQRLAHLSQLDAELARIQQRMACLGAMQNSLVILLANLGLWTVLFLALPRVAEGAIAGVHLAVLALAALASFEALAPLPGAAQHLETDLQAFSRLTEFTDTAPAVRDPPHAMSIPEPQPPPASVDAPIAARRPALLEVRDLVFFYPPALDEPAHPSPALSGISFSLDIGQSLAIVGASGAGKSSLASLLLRFWEYSSGQILLLGNDLRHYNQEQVRRLISVVPQHPYLFHATVRDNLLIARPDASEAEITRAAQIAQIDEFLRSLPQGYDTWIGEQGIRLSGGERQRIAIARALLKDAPLLILDEATAHLDALTEQHVLEALKEYSRRRAVLHLTHRLVGLENMQEIIVLQGGRIVERGQHAALIVADGWYSRMWRLQRQNLSDLFSLL